MRYWVCQSCKEGHVNSADKPSKCPVCGKVNGAWKYSDTANMRSFKLYECQNCFSTVEERTPPAYACKCGKKKWKAI